MSRSRWWVVVALLVALAPLTTLSSPSAATSCVPAPDAPTMAPVAPTAAPTVPVVQQETRIHWTRYHRRVVVGTMPTLQGQVVTSDGAVGGAEVDLFARTASDTAWRHVASATADEETGVFTFGCQLPERTTDYRVVHEPTAFHGGSSGVRRVAVARRLPDELEQAGARGFVLSGGIVPGDRALPVQLQRRSCQDCAWQTVDRTTSDRRARWSFRIGIARLRGDRTWFRVTAPGDEHNARGFGDGVWRISR